MGHLKLQLHRRRENWPRAIECVWLAGPIFGSWVSLLAIDITLSLQQSVKNQFAKIFSCSDWHLFKEMADFSFWEAAFLKKSDFKTVPGDRKLLVRNSRKRLLIGVGTELLLKAIYLKNGYCINKPKKDGPPFPFTAATAAGLSLNDADTYTLDQLINGLAGIVNLQDRTVMTDGLKTAKVFRNKEGRVVTSAHTVVPESLRAIEKALVGLYADAFGERLAVRFSLGPGEKAAWKTAYFSVDPRHPDGPG